MMGRQDAGQAPLFYSFDLEDHVRKNHLLRGIDRFLDLSARTTAALAAPLSIQRF